MSILDRDSKHLFLEKQNNSGSSFVANVNILAGQFDDVLNVSQNINHIVTTSENIEKIILVADDIDNVDIVAKDIKKVSTVANSIKNVDTCGDNIDKIVNVSNHINNVITVSSHVNQIDTVANNIQTIKTVHDWNVPRLATEIDSNRRIVEDKTAIILEKERDIDNFVTNSKQEITTKVNQAKQDIDDTLTEAKEDVTNSINTLKADLDEEICQAKQDINNTCQDAKDYLDETLEDVAYIDEKFDEFITTANNYRKETQEYKDIVYEYKSTSENKDHLLEQKINQNKNIVDQRIDELGTEFRDDITDIQNVNRQQNQDINLLKDRVPELDELKEKIDRFENINDRLDKEISNTTKNLVKISDTNIKQSLALLNLKRSFSEQQIKHDKDITHLAAIDINNIIANIRTFRNIRKYNIEESVSCCLEACKSALYNIKQTIRITNNYHLLKSLFKSVGASDSFIQGFMNVLQTVNTLQQEVSDLKEKNTKLTDIVYLYLQNNGAIIDDSGNIIIDPGEDITDLGVIDSWYG